MRKYLYSLICVFIHVISVVSLFLFNVHVLKYDVIMDVKKITIFILVFCSVEWILLGFMFVFKVKYKIKDIIILSLINIILLFFIDQLDLNILELRMSVIDIFSFKGLFLKSLREDWLGDFGIMVYIIYYVVLFIIGILTNRLLSKGKAINI